MNLSIVPWLLVGWLIWGPVIINSQPGSTWVLFGIDWKADNLDNTMFWTGIFLFFASGFSDFYQEHRQEKRQDEKDKRKYA